MIAGLAQETGSNARFEEMCLSARRDVVTLSAYSEDRTMVFFNHATRQMTAKIVYYGPGLCGKTTNLNTIYGKTSQKARGEMVSLNTETDRTLFFDLLPMDVGVIGGFKAKLQLYTVPGQVFYNSTRKLVLKGVDGIVFVADSQVPMFDANKESLQNLEANLKELSLSLRDIPMVFQWNKRDLKNIVPAEELERELNPAGHPSFMSVAQDGTGVFETLRGITKLALAHIKTHHFSEAEAPRPAAPEPPPQPAPPAPQALSLDDLPTSSDILISEPTNGKDLAAAVIPDVPHISIPAPVLPSVPPMAAVAAPKVAAPAKPVVSPMVVALTPPRPKAMGSAPKTSAAALLGDLTHLNLSAAGTLRIALPAELDGHDLEVFVEVRQQNRVIAQGEIHKSAPGKGAIAKLAVELKRN